MSGGGGRRWADEAGSLSLETVAVIPVFLAFFAFVIVAGTIQNDQGTMDAAVQAGARSGSLSRDPAAVDGAIHSAADEVLRKAGLGQCVGTVGLAPGTDGVGAGVPPLGDYNVVTATGSCEVRIDFGLISVTEKVQSDFTSVVDAYRGR
ncbi:Flp pilus assembly protein TadG [Streptacidiphilus sp. MAP12-33]|uniref:TadE/TadG family type IV pilus assembly protein n=1 Tax=Streptacidiphilus sp. MAP12-33 TaxID=3156266 RepID=UPI003512C4FB